ncbi:MAG: hypothetical protein HQK49_19865 [Oligoflexia bacterium]|nr:hypothetical protein [Oligoflexia bacterium]
MKNKTITHMPFLVITFLFLLIISISRVIITDAFASNDNENMVLKNQLDKAMKEKKLFDIEKIFCSMNSDYLRDSRSKVFTKEILDKYFESFLREYFNNFDDKLNDSRKRALHVIFAIYDEFPGLAGKKDSIRLEIVNSFLPENNPPAINNESEESRVIRNINNFIAIKNESFKNIKTEYENLNRYWGNYCNFVLFNTKSNKVNKDKNHKNHREVITKQIQKYLNDKNLIFDRKPPDKDTEYKEKMSLKFWEGVLNIVPIIGKTLSSVPIMFIENIKSCKSSDAWNVAKLNLNQDPHFAEILTLKLINRCNSKIESVENSLPTVIDAIADKYEDTFIEWQKDKTRSKYSITNAISEIVVAEFCQN